MTEQTKLVDVDPEPRNKCNTSAPGVENNPRAKNPLWKPSDNSFQFNFVPPTQNEDIAPSDLQPQPFSRELGSTTENTLGFAFNFKIPVGRPGKMAPATASQASSEVSTPGSQCSSESKKLQNVENNSQKSEPPVSSKAKKKKKSTHKKKPLETTAGQLIPSSTTVEGANGDDVPNILTAEQKLNRELDWCIEQLELGIRTQKGTPKQKEEASRALKTLRSSKAPLAKKRQVMKAMSGDYRKKMEEEKERQFKLIQAAVTSAQVTAVPEPTKKSIFHRSVDSKVHTQSKAEETQQETPKRNVQSQNTSFEFTPAKEEFRFNFV